MSTAPKQANGNTQTDDTPLPLSVLGHQPWCPKGRAGRPISFSTWWRWLEHGCRALDGTIVFLKGERTGGRWSVTRRAVREFFERLGRRPERQAVESPRTPGQRKRSADRADKLLDRARI